MRGRGQGEASTTPWVWSAQIWVASLGALDCGFADKSDGSGGLGLVRVDDFFEGYCGEALKRVPI